MVDGVREHYINNINYFIFIISKSDEDFDDAKDPHVMVSENTHSSKRNFSKVKLFFYRSAYFVGGFAVLFAGGIASRYSASLNMAKNTTNCSNSGH